MWSKSERVNREKSELGELGSPTGMACEECLYKIAQLAPAMFTT
jgi:hypothetical protein